MKTQKHFIAFALLFLSLASACQAVTYVQPTTTSLALVPSPTPDIAATQAAQMQNDAQIKLSDNEKTFTYHVTDRFSIFLDDTKYPIKNLTCIPGGVIGYVSNGSFRGPNNYPIMFEAVAEGQCVLKDGIFSATIVVANP